MAEKTFLTPRVFARLWEPIATSGRAAALRCLGNACRLLATFYSSEEVGCPLHTMSGTLKVVEPFAFQRSMDFLEGFSPMAGEQHIGDGAITKAIMVDGRVVVFRVKDAGRDDSMLSYELFSEERLESGSVKTVEERVSFFLSLDDDVQQFYSIAKDDPAYYPKVKELWGLHHVKFPSLLEISAWAIINQRIQRQIALRMKRALMERYGGSIEVEGRAYRAFPDYQRFKAATPKELLSLTRNQRTAERLGSLLDHFEELDEGFLRTAPYEKASERLRKVKGIGDWSSQFILFRGLGRMGKQQNGIKPLQQMMNEVYGPEKTLADIEGSTASGLDTGPCTCGVPTSLRGGWTS
jgi:DNA-3-methyladenine glycosylase II